MASSTVDLVPNYWLRSLEGSPHLGPGALGSALAEAGLADTALTEPGSLVPLVKEIAVFDALARQTDDPVLAVKPGQSLDSRTGSILSYIVFSSPTVGDALNNMSEFSALARPRSRVSLQPVQTGVEFRMEHPAHEAQVALAHKEFVVSGLLHTLSDATGRAIVAKRVCLAMPIGERRETLSRAFGCPVEDQAGRTAIVFDTASLSLGIRSCDAALLQHMTEYGRMLISQQRPAPETATEQVFQHVVCRMTGGVPRLGDTARSLGLSERSLSRRLAEEATSFREVVDHARASMAQGLLDDRGLSLAEISYLLGFADQSSFTHAFRRWTGHAPAQARVGRNASDGGSRQMIGG